MTKLLILSRTLLKNNFNLSLKTKKGRRNLLLYLFLLVCMTPMAFLIGSTAFTLFDAGLTRQTVLFYTLAQCMLMILLITITFPPVFYFSDDNALLLTLPLSAFDIVGAKTLVVLSSQIYPLLLTTLPLIVAFCLSSSFNWIGLLFLIGSQLLSVLVLLGVLGTIWIVVFALFPKSVNKDRFTLISGIVAVAFSIGVSVFMQTTEPSGPIDPQQISSVLNGLEKGTGPALWLFAQAPLSAEAAGNQSLPAFLLLIGLTLLVLFLYRWAAKKWYLNSAMSAGASTSRRKKVKKSELVQAPVWKGYLLNDVRVLLRTPAYSFNIVLSALILPVMLMLLLGIQAGELRPVLMEAFVHNGQLEVAGFPNWALALAVGLFVTIFIAGTSGASSNAISRMGTRGVDWMRTIPMPASTQILLKMVPGFVLSLIGSQLCTICLHMMIPYPFWMDLLFLAANLAGSLLINEIAILTDLIHPKLVWDSEMEAIKNNLNVMIDLGIAVLIFLAVLALFWVLPFEWATLGAFFIIVLSAVILWFLIHRNAAALLLKEH